jgi:competence protein ComEA
MLALTAPNPGLRVIEAKEAVMKQGYRTAVRALVASLVPMVAWSGPVNINSADAGTLARELEGVGPAKAQAIVDYRQKNGPFKSPEDLLKVQGIGDKVFDLNRENIRIGSAAQAEPQQKAATRKAAGGS